MPSRSTNCTGAASELTIAADLIRRGFDIYRAVSPHSGCDLIAVRPSDQRLWRIEVRTAAIYHRKDGSEGLTFPKNGKYDTLAVAIPDGRILYLPDFAPESS